MSCLIPKRFRAKKKEGFDLILTNQTPGKKEVPLALENNGVARLNVSENFDNTSLKPVNGPTKHDLTYTRDKVPKRPKSIQNIIDDEDRQYTDTVSSYPPDSLNNSLVSLRSKEPMSPHSIISGPIHTFVVETIPEQVTPSPVSPSPVTTPFSLQPVPPKFESQMSRESSKAKFEIPKISIESDVTTSNANDDTFTSFKSSADDENFSNSSIHSGIVMANGGNLFQKKVSPPRSPPETRSILVPSAYDLKRKLQRQLTVEEATESSADSDDGIGSSNSSVIQDSLSPPINRYGRKEGVISDLADTKELTVVAYEKDDIERNLIRAAIRENDFLNNMMDDERLRAVVDAMKSELLESGTFIITEGETGSHFYVSCEGEFEVIKGNRVIKTFGKGVVFGELAILYKAKRFASIRVTTSGKIWKLERKVFRKIMMSTGRKEQLENVNFLRSVSIFKDLPVELLGKVSDLLIREFFASGTRIIQQGDPGNKFYIIRGGTVDVVKTDDFGNERFIGKLSRGQYFGEQALLNRDKRLASIIACPPGAECLTLDRLAFENYLGGVQAIKDTKLIPEPDELVVAQKIKVEYEHLRLTDLSRVGILGVGGYGKVELVQHKKTNETFALKSLKKYEMVHQQQQKHVFNEKEIMQACDSAFIVKLFRTFRDNKYLYFLMEPCLGGDVWTVLHHKRYFDERTAKFMAACVVEAFEYLHSRNIFYRDLKPENLMLDSRGYVKLVDFGFAKYLKPNEKTWTFAGTPEYVAPEIITNKGHNRAVDYWALGIFIFELLVGKPPFRGRDHMKTYNFILRGIDVVQFPQKIPKKAQALIKRLCRQSPTERLGYQKNGIADIKNHAWFHAFDWSKIQDQTMPAPLILPVKNNTDLSNFEKPDVNDDDPPDELSGWDIGF